MQQQKPKNFKIKMVCENDKLILENINLLKLVPHPKKFLADQGKSFLQYAKEMNEVNAAYETLKKLNQKLTRLASETKNDSIKEP